MRYTIYWEKTKKIVPEIIRSSLLKSISVYTFFRVLNRTIPVLLLPFLTHYLTPADYGIIDFYLLCLLLFTPVIGFNSSETISRFYYDKDELDYPVYVSTIFYFILFTTSLWLTIILFSGHFILRMFDFQVGISFLVFLVLNSAFDQITMIQLTSWRVRNRPIPYGILGFVRTIIEIGLSVILVKYFFHDWQGRIFSQFTGALIPLLISVFILYKDNLLKIDFNFGYLKKAIDYGAPLILHGIGGILIGYSNRFFIYRYLGIDAAGIFASAFLIGLAVSLFQSSFNEAWVPYFFNLLKNSNTHQTRVHIVKITYIYILGLAFLTLFLIVILPLVYKLIDDKYISGQNLAIYIMIAYLFNGMYKMFGNYLFFVKKTKIIATGTILTLFCNLLLNFILIPRMGLTGAALSLTISFFIEFVLFVIIAQMYFRMPWLYFLKVK